MIAAIDRIVSSESRRQPLDHLFDKNLVFDYLTCEKIDMYLTVRYILYSDLYIDGTVRDWIEQDDIAK